MLRIKIVAITSLALIQSAFAVDLPSAGGQMQQIPPLPVPQKNSLEFEVEKNSMQAVPAADGATILVKSLHVTGQILYTEEELIATTGFTPDRAMTLSELRGMAMKIADYYHRNGYFVAQAYLPMQDIKDGVVTIAVIEGRYGVVTLRNQTKLVSDVPNGVLMGLNSGDPIAIVPLEHRLLLLSDLPGVSIKSTLIPGNSVGVSDLIVDVEPGQAVTGSIEADNEGNRYTGANRAGATVNLNDLSGHGDVLSFRTLDSFSGGLYYGRVTYQMPAGKMQIGASYSLLQYRLGNEFERLNAHGTATIASVFGSYPLIRSRNTNLNFMLNLDARTFQDDLDITSTFVNKRATVLTASLYGNHLDNVGGGGLSSYAWTVTAGNLDIRSPLTLTEDQAMAQTNGHYAKFGFNFSRLQTLTDTISLYGVINAQLATKNLDVSEKMELGGAYAVRAYPEGEAYGDQGYVLNVELRKRLRWFSEHMPGQIQLVGFVDTGTVRLNHHPWISELNSRTLSGAGVGLTWETVNNFSMKVYWAHKLGNTVATSAPDSKSRFWIQAVKFF